MEHFPIPPNFIANAPDLLEEMSRSLPAGPPHGCQADIVGLARSRPSTVNIRHTKRLILTRVTRCEQRDEKVREEPKVQGGEAQLPSGSMHRQRSNWGPQRAVPSRC